MKSPNFGNVMVFFQIPNNPFRGKKMDGWPREEKRHGFCCIEICWNHTSPNTKPGFVHSYFSWKKDHRSLDMSKKFSVNSAPKLFFGSTTCVLLHRAEIRSADRTSPAMCFFVGQTWPAKPGRCFFLGAAKSSWWYGLFFSVVEFGGRARAQKRWPFFSIPKGGPVLMFISVCVCVCFLGLECFPRMLFFGESLGRPKSSTKKHCDRRIKKKLKDSQLHTPANKTASNPSILLFGPNRWFLGWKPSWTTLSSEKLGPSKTNHFPTRKKEKQGSIFPKSSFSKGASHLRKLQSLPALD